MAKYDRKRKEQIWQNCSVSSWVLQLMTKQERFSKSPGKAEKPYVGPKHSRVITQAL
jgi:hypothetical protein